MARLMTKNELNDMFRVEPYKCQVEINPASIITARYIQDETLVARIEIAFIGNVWMFRDMIVEAPFRHSGFGSNIYYRMARRIGNMGYERVELKADSSIGRYAWAKKGFLYDSDRGHAKNIERLLPWAKKRSIPIPDGLYLPTPYSVATLVSRNVGVLSDTLSNPALDSGEYLPVGKAFMLDLEEGHGSWLAYKTL